MEDISGYPVTSNAIIMEAYYHVTSIAMAEMRRCQVTSYIVVEILGYAGTSCRQWWMSNCVIHDGRELVINLNL